MDNLLPLFDAKDFEGWTLGVVAMMEDIHTRKGVLMLDESPP
jgi:hypothetical protein